MNTNSPSLRATLRRRQPVLGICRGCQLLNVAHGGTLYQDLGRQVSPAAAAHRHEQLYDTNHHEVDFAPGSGLARLYPATPRARVNSIHHQAIKTLGTGLKVEGARPRGPGGHRGRARKRSGLRLRHPVAPGIHRPQSARILGQPPDPAGFSFGLRGMAQPCDRSFSLSASRLHLTIPPCPPFSSPILQPTHFDHHRRWRRGRPMSAPSIRRPEPPSRAGSPCPSLIVSLASVVSAPPWPGNPRNWPAP